MYKSYNLFALYYEMFYKKKLMKNFHKFLLIIFLFVFIVSIGGCSGPGMFESDSTSQSGKTATGTAAFKINWPQQSKSKFISSATTSFYISIRGEGLDPAYTTTVNYGSSSVRISDLPAGIKRAEISALDTLGNILSAGIASFTIEAEKTVNVSLSLGVIISSTGFSPSNITVDSGTTLFFYNSDNRTHQLAGASVFNNAVIEPGSSRSFLFTAGSSCTYYLDSVNSGISGTVIVGTPSVTDIDPLSGSSGETVTITGSGFGSSQGTSSVSFNGTDATSVTSWSDTRIVCEIPPGASTGNVSVTVNSVSSSGYAFTVFYRAYVLNGDSNTISIIRTSDHTAIGTIGGFSAPDNASIAVTSNGSFIYVTNSDANTVSVIRRSDYGLAATIDVGSNPNGISINPDSSLVYVVNRDSGNVSVIRTSDNTVTATIAVGVNPNGVCFTPDGSFAYVTNSGSNNVSVINVSNNTVSETVNVGTEPINPAITPNGNFVYVTNGTSNNVSVIRTSDNTVTATIAVGVRPFGLTVTPDGSGVYVGNATSSNMSVIRTSDNTVIATIGIGLWANGVAVTPDGSFVYAANNGSNNVSVVRTSDNTVVSTVSVGSGPAGVAIAR
ncbi:MAG: beta-propeller fold lactonase family protein [Armatimonadota bacterium]